MEPAPTIGGERALGGGRWIRRLPDALVVSGAEPFEVVSSAVLGGGRGRARTIVNRQVALHYRGDRPDLELREAARSAALAEPIVGLMTAVDLDEALVATARLGGQRIDIVATCGTGNAVRAGELAVRPGPGTINLILLVDAPLSEAAAIELVIVASETKAGALAEAGILSPSGMVATGTSTDAVVVGWSPSGAVALAHAGTATDLGRATACLVRLVLPRGPR